MLELAVTASLRNQEPAFLLQKSEDPNDLHFVSTHGPARRCAGTRITGGKVMSGRTRRVASRATQAL